MNPGLRAVIPALLLLLTPLLASAENSTRQSGYTVHHNAFPTAILTPDIAGSYQIVRSKYRGMLNVSVIKEKEGTTGTPVSANIQANMTNIYGQQSSLNLREIREEKAIYYIGTFLVRNGESLNFHLDVKPEGESKYSPAAFSEEFFID